MNYREGRGKRDLDIRGNVNISLGVQPAEMNETWVPRLMKLRANGES